MEYYSYEKERLLEGRIKIRVLGEEGEVFYQAAMDMLEVIEANNALGKQTVLIVPVGPTKQYDIFVRLVNEKGISLKNVYFINMDEYLKVDGTYIDSNNSLSFRGYMQSQVYDKIHKSLVMDENHRLFPDPRKPGILWDFIENNPVDACFGGVGINGHIAFNEPGDGSVEEFSERKTRVLKIAPETLTTNAISALSGALEAMPEFCVTIGMKEILSAKKIRLYCFQDWHRAVIRRAAFGEVSARFPVTILQNHPDSMITVPNALG